MNAFDRKGVVKEKRTKIHMSQAIAHKIDPYLPLVINDRSPVTRCYMGAGWLTSYSHDLSENLRNYFQAITFCLVKKTFIYFSF